MTDYFPIMSFLRVLRSDEKGKRALDSPAIMSGFVVSRPWHSPGLFRFRLYHTHRPELEVLLGLNLGHPDHKQEGFNPD